VSWMVPGVAGELALRMTGCDPGPGSWPPACMCWGRIIMGLGPGEAIMGPGDPG